MRNELPNGPLEDIKVLDLSRVLAGPYCTQFLGEMGACVIKVERPGKGDDVRSWGPPFVGEDSTYYLSSNRNKRSIALDFNDVGDRALARRLACEADVLVENFRAGFMDRIGMDYASLAEDNPGLVYCSVSAFGEEAGAAVPGYDFLVQAISGLMSITGRPDGEPTKVGVALVDVITGLNATIGILAALRHREVSGDGQHVSVDLMSSAMASLANQASAYLNAEVTPRRLGNLHPSIAPYESFETADLPIAIAIGNDQQFTLLCDALGVPQLAEDERFRSNQTRVGNRERLHELLSERLRRGARDGWLLALQPLGIPCGPINDIPDAFAWAKQLGLDLVHEQATSDGGVVRGVVSPVKMSLTGLAPRRPPPRLDEHGEEIRRLLFTEPPVQEPGQGGEG